MLRYCTFFYFFFVVYFEDNMALPTACNELPRPLISIDELVAHQPYNTYWSDWPIFQCSQVAYIPPQTGQTGFNLTNVVLAGPAAVYFNLILNDGNIWDATLCSSGYRNDYPTIYKNFNGDSKALCVASCGPDKISYKNVMCWGKTDADRNELKQFLDRYQIPAIFDARLGCDLLKNQICSAIDKGLNFINSITTPKLFG